MSTARSPQHDLIGHQLTVLTLELEAARHRTGEQAREHVDRANLVARSRLLADVRTTVGELRTEPSGLREALHQVVRDLPGLEVSIDVGTDVRVDERPAAAFVRTVQEIVTNTLRHAGARELAITVTCEGAAVVLTGERRARRPQAGAGQRATRAHRAVRGTRRHRSLRWWRRVPGHRTGAGVVTRVVVVDDHTLVRQGIRSLLEVVEVEVVGEADDGQAALEIIEGSTPDVILLDLRMPRYDGIWTLQQLRARGIEIPTLVLTTFDDDTLVLDALHAGARGYLLKDVTLDQLTRAVRTLADGGTLIAPSITDWLLRAIRSGPCRSAPTPRRYGNSPNASCKYYGCWPRDTATGRSPRRWFSLKAP